VADNEGEDEGERGKDYLSSVLFLLQKKHERRREVLSMRL